MSYIVIILTWPRTFWATQEYYLKWDDDDDDFDDNDNDDDDDDDDGDDDLAKDILSDAGVSAWVGGVGGAD